MNFSKLKKSCLFVFLVIGLCANTEALASKSSVSVMSPRNTIKINKDYTYGYSYLAGDALDVYETSNREIGWKINYEFLDAHFLRPVAVSYVTYIPEGIRICFRNIRDNIHEPNNIVNNALVGRFGSSAISTGRFVVNSTIGLLGCFDVASHLNMTPQKMTFGTVLGKWGMQEGAILNIPFAGVYTYREIIGSTVDILYYPYNQFPLWLSIILWGHGGIDSRAQLLDQDDMLRNSIDPYSQVRDFYLMYKEGLVNDDSKDVQIQETQDLEEYMDEID
ncbi:MAG: VacJ family lipoprotein [Succinivibrionaceae bacterium]